MLFAQRGGVEPGLAHGVLAAWRCVAEHARDELVNVQSEHLVLVIAVVDVGQVHGGACEIEGVARAQRAALDVAGEVQRDTAAVLIGLADLYVPVAAPLGVQHTLPVRTIVPRRQLQLLRPQGLLQLREQLAAEQVLQCPHRHQEALAGGVPLLLGVEPAGADEAVHVWMAAQRAAPGVQRHEQAGRGTQVPGIGAQLQQALACAIEQQLVEPGAVELPQRDELVRQGEDDVEVRAGQQARQLRGQPLLAGLHGAARAAAVATGVVLHLAVVACGAGHHMRAHLGAMAVADAPGRVPLACMQCMALRIRLKVPIEDLLQRALHAISPRPMGKVTSPCRDCADAGRRPASALFAA